MIPYSCDTVFECDVGKIDIRPLFVVLSSDPPQARDKCFYRQPNKVNSFKLEEEEKNTHQPDPLQPKSGPSIVAPCPGCSCQCPGHYKGMVGGGRGLQKGWLMFKGIVTQFVFFQLNLIFWIVMVVWYCSFWGVYKPPKLDNSDVEVCPHGPQITAHCAAAFKVPLRRHSRKSLGPYTLETLQECETALTSQY